MLRLFFEVPAQGDARLRAIRLPTGLSVGPRPSGRGVNVHPRQDCLDGAVKRGLARGLRRKVRLSPAELRDHLKRTLNECLGRLLAAARRQQALPAERLDAGQKFTEITLSHPQLLGKVQGVYALASAAGFGGLEVG